MTSILDCAGKPLDLSQPCVMGILNVTPDSFSDGGDFFSKEQAVAHASMMVEAGAAIIDIGGESTRPGARAVSGEEELARVLPVLEVVSFALSVPISVDTSKPEVMRAAARAGAGMINDVQALRAEGALVAARDAKVPICLMHMQGEPQTMQEGPRYDNVVSEVAEFLRARVETCTQAGIPRERLVVDPGFGFGKTLEHNLSMLGNLSVFCAIGLPVMVGVSRKAMLGALLDKPVGERLYGSLAAAVIAALNGAVIIRAHDVQETAQALAVVHAIKQAA